LVKPSGVEGVVGVTAMLTRVAFDTVSVVLAVMPPKLAVIRLEPVFTDVARPFEPEAFEIRATEPVSELHVVVAVTKGVVPSE